MVDRLVFTGTGIRTMDAGTARATAVVVEGDRIAAVGDQRLLGRFPDGRRIELGPQPLLPGFVDAHNHLSLAALTPRWADVSEARSVAEIGAALERHARVEPAAPWVRATGWERNAAVPLCRDDLDALGLDRPVVVEHFSIHQAVVCSRGLAALGLERTTPDPPGGRIERDAGGRPTGMLVETAWGRAHAVSLRAHAEPERWAALIRARMAALLAEGVTAVHDAACPPAAEAVYRRLHAAGGLDVSVLVMPHPTELMAPLDRGRLEGPVTGEGDARLRVGPVKLFADGGAHPDMQGCVAGRRERFGLAFPDLTAQARAAGQAGFAIAVHAMGNRGLDRAVAAVEAVRGTAAGDRVARIEHATLASASQLRRLAAIGATAVVQPGFRETLGRHIADLRFDDLDWMPFAQLAEAGCALAASSDNPCSPLAPLETAAMASEARHDEYGLPGEPLPYEDWLAAWTDGAARAGGQADERGRLAPGLQADLVVLDGPLDPRRPPRVAETWVAGQPAYTHKGV